MTRTRWSGHAAIALAASCAPVGWASSHNDAPLIKQDPQANLTDVYAFVGTRYDDPASQVLNVIVSVRPFSEPGDGPHYDRFASDALYSIHITDPASGQEVRRYDFRFSSPAGGIKNPDTILSNGLGTEAGPILNVDDARQNFTQRYDVARRAGGSSSTIGSNLLTPPPNVGLNTTPAYNDVNGWAVSGAASFAELDVYTRQTIHPLPSGEVVFAGARDDGFYADIPGTFDLLNVRILDNDGDLGDGLGQDWNGVDGFKGFNVLTYAIQVPLSGLTAMPYTSAFFGAQHGVGVYASVSRPETRTESVNGPSQSGPWVQVNRLGNPVFNEALVPLADKDRYNRLSPTDDAAEFAQYAENSELAFLINFVYGTSLVTAGRTDLVNVFIPDVLRVNTTTGPVPLSGQPGFHRLGFLGGDTTGGASSGWPNGRRVGDDVIDIALTAVASGPSYTTITPVGDNIIENNMPYNQVFPYLGTPNSGTNHRKDRLSTDIDGDGDVDIDDLLFLLLDFGRTMP